MLNPPLCLCPKLLKTDSPSSNTLVRQVAERLSTLGIPFRNLLSSRLVLWKVKALEVVGMAWGRAEVKTQVQSYHMPKQREKPHGILPTAPKGKLSCLGNNPWGLRPASVQAEHPAVSMVTLHPGKCGSPPIAQVLSDLVRIIFLTAPRKVNHPGRERDLCY